MVTVIKNYDKEDCKYFKWNFTRGCCGRRAVKSGGCGAPLDTAVPKLQNMSKVCSTSLEYCKYEKKETT